MTPRKRWFALALTLMAATACTPEELQHYFSATEPTRAVLTDGQLHSLRSCESTDNYAAVSGSGRYRGAYQFSQGTWDGVASRHFPWLVGVDPAAAEFWWQDAMARALFSESGSSPWPHCGNRI